MFFIPGMMSLLKLLSPKTHNILGIKNLQWFCIQLFINQYGVRFSLYQQPAVRESAYHIDDFFPLDLDRVLTNLGEKRIHSGFCNPWIWFVFNICLFYPSFVVFYTCIINHDNITHILYRIREKRSSDRAYIKIFFTKD